MKKLLFTIGLALSGILFISNQASAQSSYGTAGLDLVLPVSDDSFTEFATFGYGVKLGYEVGISESFGININAGFLNYALDSEIEDLNFMQVPVQLGARYYIDESQSGLFIGAKVGAHVSIYAFDEAEGEDYTDLSFAPEVGYFVTNGFSVDLRYQFISVAEDEDAGRESTTISYLALTAAFHF